MEKTYKDILDARDYINGLIYETVNDIIFSKDKIVYDNSIIDDFMNYCRGIDIFVFNRESFYKIRDCWVIALNSTILNAFDHELNKD